MSAFDTIAVPEPEPVDPRFAGDLRTRLQRALVPALTLSPAAPTPTRSTTMAQVITPYLCVHDGRAAIDWYREHFGAAVSNVIDWEGKVGHAELEVGGAVFYLSDEAPGLGVLSPRTLGPGASVSMVLSVAVVDAFVERAVAGGATLERPIEEAHGSRNGWLMDPFGHRWNIGTPLRSEADTAARRRPAEPYYLTLTTPDVERGAAFYGAVLDWNFADPHNGGRHVTNTTQPIGLRPPENPFSATTPGEIEMWWTVRDFDDALERVRIAGGTVLSVSGYDSGREARCVDDQGIEFRLNEPAPGYDTMA